MNNITIVGNLTSPKGIKNTTNSAVAKRSIAENLSKDVVQYTDLEAWNSAKGDLASQLDGFAKGSYVEVKGFLKHGSFVAKDGSNRRTTHVVVTSISAKERPAKKNAAPAAAAAPAGDFTDAEDEVVF